MRWEKEICENVRSGIVELLILRLLCEGDMYGYGIRNTLAERTLYAFDLKEAALYGPLYRMSSRGLISSRKELVGEKRFRVYYHIEEEGRRYLEYGEEQLRYVFSGIMGLLDWKGGQHELQQENHSSILKGDQ